MELNTSWSKTDQALSNVFIRGELHYNSFRVKYIASFYAISERPADAFQAASQKVLCRVQI